MAKPQTQLGQRAWAVEWLDNTSLAECGDLGVDALHYSRCIVATRDAADKLARHVYQKSASGAVQITEVELTDQYGNGAPHEFSWQTVSEPHWYQGG